MMPPAPRPNLPTEEQGRVLLDVAFRALRSYFHRGNDDPDPEVEVEVEVEVETGELPRAAGVFATLECGEELRGCIGFLRDDMDVATLTRRAVVAAAVDDPRFHPLTKEEVPDVRISVTVLAPPVTLNDISEIRIGRDGLIVERGFARGLLLPQVASRNGWDAERFCSETCRKAGLPLDAWRDEGTKVLRFEAVHFDSPGSTG